MPKYPKHIVDLANGGIFRRVVAKNFHFTKATREAIEKAHKKADDLAKRNPVTGKRNKYVGSTPSKTSKTGQDVLARMHGERKVRGWDPKNPKDISKVTIKGSDGKWYKINECDMGHAPIDAVTYWNNVGRYHGPKSGPVRDWMKSPDSYELQPSVLNQGDGRAMGASGIGYQPPVTLPKGVDIKTLETDILDQLKNFKNEPAP